MPRIRFRKCYVSFREKTFNCDAKGPLVQQQVRSIWESLPTTGAAWIERGHLYVQDKDPDIGGQVFNLGPVAPNVKHVHPRSR